MSDDNKMGDLTGIGQLANSEVAKQVYSDALAPLMKHVGELGEDIAKTARLILFPLQLLACVQDRFAKWVTEIARDVPEERRQEVPSSVSGPVLRSLICIEEGNPIRRLYLELLKRAIDKDRQSEAHPAFVRIIEHLSPDEAMLLYVLRQSPIRAQPVEGAGQTMRWPLPNDKLIYPANGLAYVQHLVSLALCTMPGPGTMLIGKDANTIKLTAFGVYFAKACIPDDFDLPTK